VDVYVSTAWLSEAGWALLEEAMRLSGFRRYAEVVRAAVNTAVVEVARGAGLVPPASVEVERKAPFRPQLGRLREVAVRLVSSIPLRRIQKWVAERLGASKASMGVALEWALATYVRVLRQKPAGLPEPVRDMLRVVFAEVEKAPRGERKKAAVQQMWLRMEAARKLAKALDLPVDKWWMAIAKEVEASGDPLEALRRYLGGEVPKILSSNLFGDLMGRLLAEAKTPEEFKRLWWLRREALRRAAANKYERELVDYISRIVDADPEAARKLAEMAARGQRVEIPAPEPPDPGLAAVEVEERLVLFDKAVEDVLRDPEGVEKAIYKRAEFFEAFYKWAKSALRGDLPERLGAKLKSALEVAYYCRPGGLMYAAKEAEERRKPLPPEHPAVYAVKNYAKTWLRL
jgi:hypothetical protein